MTRRSLVALLLLLWAVPALAQPAYRSGTRGDSQGTSGQVTFGTTVQIGDLMIFCGTVSSVEVAITGISGGGGATWTKALSGDLAGREASMWYAWSNTAATHTLTVTVSGTYDSSHFQVAAFSGTAVGTAPPQTNQASGTGTALNSGNITTTATNQLGIGCLNPWSSGHTFTAGSGWTELSLDFNRVNMESRVLSTAGTYAADGTIDVSDDWRALVAAFCPTGGCGGGGGGGGTDGPKRFPLLGVGDRTP